MKNPMWPRFLIVLGLVVFWPYLAVSQMGPEPPPPPLALEIDSSSNVLKTFNYQLAVSPFTHSKKSFALLKNYSAMVFYFSAKCPHCQKATPHVLRMAHELIKDSVFVYALAVGSNSESDLAQFVSKFKVDIPVFRDEKRAFARDYGTGRVPLIMLINKKGNYIQLKGFNVHSDPQRIAAVFQNKNLLY